MQETRREEEIEIDLRELIGVVLHWFWLIAICAVATGMIGFFVSKFGMTPMYESTTKVFVLSKNDGAGVTYSDLQLGSQIVDDYIEIIKSRNVLEGVIEKCDIDSTYKGLYDRVTVSLSSDRVIAIKVMDESPAMAQKLADEIRLASAERIKSVMDIEAVNVVDEASLPGSPAEPSVTKITLIAFLLGGFLCAGVVVVRFLLDDTIKTGDDVEKYLGLSTLGMIPDAQYINKKRSKKAKK